LSIDNKESLDESVYIYYEHEIRFYGYNSHSQRRQDQKHKAFNSALCILYVHRYLDQNTGSTNNCDNWLKTVFMGMRHLLGMLRSKVAFILKVVTWR